MKKCLPLIIITILLFSYAVNTQAQVRFGVRAGLNLANMHIKGMPEGTELKTIPSFHVGAGIEYGFTKHFAMEANLLLSGKGTKMISTFAGITYTGKAHILPFYMEIPVNAVYKMELRNFNLHLFAGPYLGVGLFGKIKEEYTAINLPAGVTLESMGLKNRSYNIAYGNTNNSHLKRTDVGLNAGVGIEFKNIQIRAQYGFSLTNLDPRGLREYDTKNRVASLSVGYMFDK